MHGPDAGTGLAKSVPDQPAQGMKKNGRISRNPCGAASKNWKYGEI
jgi:hypothetical protein